jgi:uncharacterized protein (DUF1330 family)
MTAKGYWIPHLDVTNPEGYKAYMAATPPAHHKYGGRALVRGGTSEVVEGRGRSRNVLREFPDYATALACYRSGEYQSAKPLRLPHSACDFVIVEGYDGAQPSPLPFPPPLAGEGGEGGATRACASGAPSRRASLAPLPRRRGRGRTSRSCYHATEDARAVMRSTSSGSSNPSFCSATAASRVLAAKSAGPL